MQFSADLIAQSPDTDSYRLCRGETALSYAEVIDLWIGNNEFRCFFTTCLVESRFAAFRWETPPVTRPLLTRAFEFVLLRSPGLDRDADRAAFSEHFLKDDQVVHFENLGRDAHLIVPCPLDANANYAHLAAFVRTAPAHQTSSLWHQVGVCMKNIGVSRLPRWLSTAGMGVAWLHVRIDQQPKYYGHAPYRVPPARQP